MDSLKVQTISKAQKLLSGHIIQTPCIPAPFLSNRLSRNSRGVSFDVYFKCEHLQSSGSFKYRGALYKLLQLTNDECRKGVASYSTGNHALALSFASRTLNSSRRVHIPLQVFMSSSASEEKIRLLRSRGAQVNVLGNDDMEMCRQLAEDQSQRTGSFLIPPANDTDVTIGQATVAEEVERQIFLASGRKPDVLIVPCGRGSLLSGSLVWFANSSTHVFAAEPAYGGPQLSRSLTIRTRLLRDGKSHTVADGLATSVGERNWEVIRNHKSLKGVVCSSEDQTLKAMKLFATNMNGKIEPSSAVGIGAALSGLEDIAALQQSSRVVRVCIVLTGGNLEQARFDELCSRSKQ